MPENERCDVVHDGKAVVKAGTESHDVDHADRYPECAGPIVAPRYGRAVSSERQAMIPIGYDLNNIAQSSGHICLPIGVIAPGNHRAIVFERQTMISTRGNRRHITQVKQRTLRTLLRTLVEHWGQVSTFNNKD